MDGISTSDIPVLLLLFGLPTLIVGLPVIWSVRHRASFARFTRRYHLNRYTLLAVTAAWWAIESSLDHRWISTAIAAAGALCFLWYSRRAPRRPLTTA